MKMFNKKRVILLVLITAFYFVSCVDVPQDLVIPEWDVDLNVPIINKSYTLKDIIKDQDQITIDTTEDNDIYLLQSGKYFLNSSLSEFVQIDESTSIENIRAITSGNDSFVTYVKFPEGLEIDSAEFATGIINFNVSNPSSEDVSVVLKIPALYNLHGESITLQTDVASGESNSVSRNIDGYKYKIPLDHPSALKNSFRVVVKVFSTQPGLIVYADMAMSDISFNYMTGIIPSKSLGDITSRYDFNFGEGEDYRDRAILSDAKLNLRANYLSTFNDLAEIEVKDLNIIGRRKDKSEFYLKDKTGNPNFTIRIGNGTYNKIFTEANSNITDFINFIPDTVILRAEYIVNPENNSATFSSLDSIRFETDFSTKSYLALRNTTIEDKSFIEFTDSDRKEMRDGKTADIKFEIENGIPLTTWLKIDLLDENHNYLFTLTGNQPEGDSISFGAASVDENGEVLEPYLNPVKTVTLNEWQVQLFSRAHYVNYRVSFSTENSDLNPPEIVAIRPSNWINVKAYGKIKYRIGSDD